MFASDLRGFTVCIFGGLLSFFLGGGGVANYHFEHKNKYEIILRKIAADKTVEGEYTSHERTSPVSGQPCLVPRVPNYEV